jgi:hypothetical protein
VPDGVRAGQLSGHFAGAARRPADHAGQRRDEPRSEERDTDEQPEHTAAHERRDRDAAHPAGEDADRDSVGSVANSRVRWATVIDSVLKITNAPTSSAMPPNR